MHWIETAENIIICIFMLMNHSNGFPKGNISTSFFFVVMFDNLYFSIQFQFFCVNNLMFYYLNEQRKPNYRMSFPDIFLMWCFNARKVRFVLSQSDSYYTIMWLVIDLQELNIKHKSCIFLNKKNIFSLLKFNTLRRFFLRKIFYVFWFWKISVN